MLYLTGVEAKCTFLDDSRYRSVPFSRVSQLDVLHVKDDLIEIAALLSHAVDRRPYAIAWSPNTQRSRDIPVVPRTSQFVEHDIR